MLKQHNMFTNRIDLITDENDSRAKIALEMYKLQEQAGRITGAHAPKIKAQKPRRPEQTKLF
jgi:hypothetical protein